MNDHTIAMIKIFIASLSLVAYGDFSSMLRISSSAAGVSMSPVLWFQLFMFLVYVTMPIIVLLINNYVSYTLLAGVFLLRIMIEFMGIFPLPFGLHMLIAPLYILAAFLSLILAVENLSSKIRGEILRLRWSQF